MRKLFLSAIAASALCFNASAQDANVYASQLKASAFEDSYKVSFFLNADAENVTVKIYGENGAVVKSFDKGAFSKGANETTVSGADLQGSYKWSIVAKAAAKTEPVLFSDATVPSQQYKAAAGIAVNKNMESEHFGEIIISNSISEQLAGGRNSKEGIFILDAAMGDLLNRGEEPLTGNVAWSTTAGSISSPCRVALDDDGNVFICDWTDGHSGVWMMNREDPEADFVEVFGGERNDVGLASKDGVDIHGSIPTLAVVGSRVDRKLYTLDEDMLIGVAKFPLCRYDIGALANPWDVAPSAIVYANPETLLQNSAQDMAIDNNGGIWVSQHRWADAAAIPGILHVTAEGTVDYISGSLGTFGVLRSIAISDDNTMLAIGVQDYIWVFDVTYAGGAYTLTKKYDLDCASTGTYGLAFDAANNLYAGSSMLTSLVAYALPSENSFETIAPTDFNFAGVGAVAAEKASVAMDGNQLVVKAENANVAIYSVSGAKVYEAEAVNNLTVNTADWNNGLYIVKVNNQSFKVIK